jgi:hypothetical protein
LTAAEKAQCDNTLAGAGTAFDDHDGSCLGGPGSFDGLHHQLVGHLLLVQQHELFAVLGLRRGMGEKRLGGAVGEAEELVSRFPVGSRRSGDVEQ